MTFNVLLSYFTALKTIVRERNARMPSSAKLNNDAKAVLVVWRTFTAPLPRIHLFALAMKHTLHDFRSHSAHSVEHFSGAFMASLTSMETRQPCMAEKP